VQQNLDGLRGPDDCLDLAAAAFILMANDLSARHRCCHRQVSVRQGSSGGAKAAPALV